MGAEKQYADARHATVLNLRSMMNSSALRELSELSLPEIEAMIEQVAQVVPAGNVPAMILSGLARVAGRKSQPKTVRRDINALFKGVEQALDRAVFSAFFAGPAAVLWGYQNLLKLVGQDLESAFPEGTWQFYADYALREDTARHANETHGFDTLLNLHHLRLSHTDRVAAWVMAAVHCVHEYDNLLENEWRERVMTALLRDLTRDMPESARYAGLYREWEKRRPYRREQDSEPWETYPHYRRVRFDRFMDAAVRDLPAALRRKWQGQLRAAEDKNLPAYQRQMSILGYLKPEEYGETREPLPLDHVHVGVIYRGEYYLIPVCQPGTKRPSEVATVRAQVAGILAGNASSPARLSELASIRRTALAGLRGSFSPVLKAALDQLQTAPVLLNTDPRPRLFPLSDLRRAERGVGSHPLTIFDTGETFVFDQSHIFFDGAWGAALAEILTNEALAWAAYLHSLPAAQPGPARVRPLVVQFQPSDLNAIRQAPRTTPEVGVETDRVDLPAIVTLRKLMNKRSDMLGLTVNDLLILYRAIHAVTYRPSETLNAALKQYARQKTHKPAIKAVQEVLNPSSYVSAAVVVPVDASLRVPAERVHPVTFEVPLEELDLLNLHQQTLAALEVYKSTPSDRSARLTDFTRLQRRYLAALAGFGEFSRRVKAVAIEGNSASIGTLKLLAHIPAPVRRLLEQIPERFDMLNDLIRGREVFSNVGAVVLGSTLVRFITAKDDNDKKTLCWGVITDAAGIMRISLRDFRPHVALLEQAGLRDLAALVAQDYLDAYALGLNTYIGDLQRIVLGSRTAG